MNQFLIPAIVVTLLSATVACGRGDEAATTPDQTAAPPPSSTLVDDVTTSSVPTTETPGAGLPTGDVRADGFPVGEYGAGWSPVGASIGYLGFGEDGTGVVRTLDADYEPTELPFAYVVADERIEFTTTDAECTATGTYSWSFDGSVLDLEMLDDDCVDRVAAIGWVGGWGADWYTLGDMPVVEAEPSSDPITATTNIGEITWQVVPGRRFQSEPVAFHDGFAAIIGDDIEAHVMTSPDGLDWTAIPDPPSPAAYLAARGDELYVVGAWSPRQVHLTQNLGETWTALAFDTLPNDEVVGLHAGPGGVVLTALAAEPATAESLSSGSDAAGAHMVVVTVSDLPPGIGNELAGVLYAGDVSDLDGPALGGFWSPLSDDDATATEIVRESGVGGGGRFPHVSDEPLTVEPGTYTLVLWVDFTLEPVDRWVPVNSDGQGLIGCQVSFEVGDTARTEVAVSPELRPDGWNVDCATGDVIPGTEAAAAEHPTRGNVHPSVPGDHPVARIDTSLWVRDGSVFTSVESAPSPLFSILPVDSGFFGSVPGEPDRQGRHWHSEDGRTWTEIGDLPSGLDVQSAWGDTVFGSSGVDQGVTSQDGGRTWGDPVVRPGGPGDWMIAVDPGYVMIETALFGPAVGVVWASADGENWQRVLNPWPPPYMGQPVIGGNTILIPSEVGDPDVDPDAQLDWVGTITSVS